GTILYSNEKELVGKTFAVSDKLQRAKRSAAEDMADIAEAGIAGLLGVLRVESPLTVKSIRSQVQARMSKKAGIICDQESVGRALFEA
ncbi:hypothetical protein, partial [Rhizobium leguminosarum]|uniref:hypothetical protein n=1 Tax=Rhizobium leguminosarum TaxID=384 RepID=UPI003F98BC0C